MPTYFFNLISDDKDVDDFEGQAFDTLEVAVQDAEFSLCEIAGDALRSGADVHLEGIIISDEMGHEVARITTEQAILPRFTAFSKFRPQ